MNPTGDMSSTSSATTTITVDNVNRSDANNPANDAPQQSINLHPNMFYPNPMYRPDGEVTETESFNFDMQMRPEGDMSSTATICSQRVHDGNRSHRYNGATAFMEQNDGDDFYDPNRPLSDLQMNIISSYATKPLVTKLMDILNFTTDERAIVAQNIVRSHVCFRILLIWIYRTESQTRSVNETAQLLRLCGEQFNYIAERILRSPF